MQSAKSELLNEEAIGEDFLNVVPEMETNRLKAIVASNLCSICGIAVMCLSKIACNQKGVNGFDIVVFEIIFSLIASFMYVILFMPV